MSNLSESLFVNDCVLVDISQYLLSTGAQNSNNNDHLFQIGIIKYIGSINGYDPSITDWIGIELIEPIANGHNGIINGIQYFQCETGHGIHTRIANVIRELSAFEITKKLQETTKLLTTRLHEYVTALQERDDYIEELKNKIRAGRRRNADSTSDTNNDNSSNDRENDNDNKSDDEVLNDLERQNYDHLKSNTKDMNDTFGSPELYQGKLPIKSKILKMHEYQPTMCSTFNANGYECPVGVLDELSSYLQVMINPTVCNSP